MKKIWTILLLLCFALCVETCAEGFEFTLAGEGTAENPYLIASAEDLMQFASVMNDEKQYIDYYDCHLRLAADIVLNDCSDFDGWSENPPENVWTPIGYYHGFKGVFDGNGHTVSGLYIDQPITEIEYDGYSQVMDKFGLFGTVGGEVKNLTIQNAFVCPKDVRLDKGESLNVGILAGSSSGVIRNCRVEGVVICEGGDCGGIVGSGSEIIDCSFQGKIIEKAGGKVNHIGGIAGSGSNIRGCTVSAQIICEEMEDKRNPHATIGGIAGICQAFGRDDVIEDCTFDGEIMSGDYAGGIVGLAGAGSFQDVGGKTIIRNCTNNGSITAMEDAGGIVGYVGTAPYFTLNSGERTLDNINVEDAYLSITNCASTGRFIHKDARFADDVSENLLEKWRLSGVQNPLNYFIALEGGILGTISDQEAYSVSIADCRFENIERAYDDWNLPHDH